MILFRACKRQNVKKYPHSSGDKRRAILRWGTIMVVSTSKPPPCTPNQQAIANYSKLYPGGPIPHNLARALMPRQPYSVAVLSTGGRFCMQSHFDNHVMKSEWIQRTKGNDQRLVVPLCSFRGNCIRCICHHHKGCNQTKDGETITPI